MGYEGLLLWCWRRGYNSKPTDDKSGLLGAYRGHAEATGLYQPRFEVEKHHCKCNFPFIGNSSHLATGYRLRCFIADL